MDVDSEPRMHVKRYDWGARLAVENVDAADNGRYTCVARNAAGVVSTTGIIVVRSPSKLS